jgi:hypothetical protein
MARTLSAKARLAIFSPETPSLFVVLVAIGEGVLSPPIRVCSGGANLTHQGDAYLYAPFRITLPSDIEQQSQVTIEIDNVDRSIAQAAYAVVDPLPVTIKIVLADQPDVIEAGPYVMTLRGLDVDALLVTGALAFEDLLNEPYPADQITPALFPGSF